MMGTRILSGGKPYGFRERPGTCWWCGDKLHAQQAGGAGGYQDNGKFDTLGCGFQWAVWRARGWRA